MGNKADRISKRALDAHRGAIAEEEVGNLFGELPAGYFVVNDFVLRRGNIDHIVISTKGILTVETKSHRGVVTCEGEMLKRDGKPFEKDFIKQGWGRHYPSEIFSLAMEYQHQNPNRCSCLPMPMSKYDSR